MSRIGPNTLVTITEADQLKSDFFEHRFIQAADPETLQRLFEQQVAEFAAKSTADLNWGITHIDLAGAGDGHVFTLSTLWWEDGQAGSPEVDGAAPPSGVGSIKMFFFMASQAEALAAARKAIQSQIAARFDEPNVDEVIEGQTLFAGAQQGTRFMGAVATGTAQLV
jgi:hypothetical protein